MTSPFKFLDAYTIADKRIFFGRDAEVAALYALYFQTRLILVYGQSGTGKTSIIQCGLANRFKETDWFPVFVRRKDDINAALDAEIRRLAPTPIKPGADVVRAINSLYLDHLRPITLIFDQFEELFILGSEQEQQAFFASVSAVLASDLNCKIIISMREEYIAQLQGFEKVVPTLFDKRLRIEQMTPANVEAVITGTVGAAGITLEHGSATAERIISSISDRRTGVQLAYLQVYLDRLYRDAARTATPQLFSDALIARAGALGDVMAVFLDEQSVEIETGLRQRHPGLGKDVVQRVLEQLTTLEGTKLPVTRAELAQRLPGLSGVLDDVLAALESSRIIRNVDGIFELSHDALAGRIADRRGADRKAMLRIEKLLRDRLAGFADTRTYMSPEELAVVRPVLGELQLSPAERAFFEKSSDRARRRRRLIVGGTAAVMAVLAGFGAVAYDGRQKATNALSLASGTTNDLAFTIFENLEGIEGTQDIRLGLLAKVAEVDSELARGGAPANSSAPFWRDVLKGDIAQEAWDNRRTPQDFAKAEALFQNALALAEKMARAFPEDPDWRRNQSVALGRLGRLLASANQSDAARAKLAAAVDMDTALTKAAPGIQTEADLSASLDDLATLEINDGAIDKAAGHLRQSLAILRPLASGPQGNSDMQSALAARAMKLAGVELDRGAFAPAQALYSEAAGLLGALVKLDPKSLEWRALLAEAWQGVADSALSQTQWDAARRASDQAIDVARRLAKIDSDNFERQNQLSNLWRQRAEIEKQAGNLPAARESAQTSLDAALQLQEADSKNPLWRTSLALSYRQFADVESGRCRFDAAREAAVKGLEIGTELYKGSNGTDYNDAYNLYQAHWKRAEIESHDRAFKAAAGATEQALTIARELQRGNPDDKELANDIKQLEITKTNFEARIAPPLPKGCPPGSPG
jgi:tetratricopeptide (TPR) repeat protein